MEIKKIKLIEMPRIGFTLNPKDMNAIIGGSTCTSFDSCSSSRLNSCTTYAAGELCGGSGDKTDVKCGTYNF